MGLLGTTDPNKNGRCICTGYKRRHVVRRFHHMISESLKVSSPMREKGRGGTSPLRQDVLRSASWFQPPQTRFGLDAARILLLLTHTLPTAPPLGCPTSGGLQLQHQFEPQNLHSQQQLINELQQVTEHVLHLQHHSLHTRARWLETLT